MDYITKIVLRPLAYILIAGCTILCSGCAGEHVTTGAVQRISAAEQNMPDHLVHSNTGNLENDPASLYGYPEVTLIKVLGWNS